MTSRQTVSLVPDPAPGADAKPLRRGDRLATRAEVAEFLVVPVATLDQWAYKRIGPPYRVIGRHARYSWADVDRWVEAQGSGGGAA